MTDALLKLEAITRNFGAIQALRGVDLEVARGEVEHGVFARIVGDQRDALLFKIEPACGLWIGRQARQTAFHFDPLDGTCDG